MRADPPPPRRAPVPIRRAGFSDSAQLTHIAHAAKRHWKYPDELILLWQRDLTVTPSDIGEGRVFCAEHDGRIVGFYSVSGIGSDRELEHMWVLPEHIGTGLGRALFEHMVAQLRAADVTTLKIASDPNAVGFYVRMGARLVGNVPATPERRTLPLLELVVAR